jgi:hypothetical protein
MEQYVGLPSQTFHISIISAGSRAKPPDNNGRQ